jgi:predicted transcriptional regulator
MMLTRERGRPPGKTLPHVKNLRMSGRDMERLQRLAAKMELSASDVARIAIRELARRESVD